MADYLKPGITTNWDAQMQKDLLAELKQVGIDPATLSDRVLVEKVSAWAMRSSKFVSFPRPPFLVVDFPGGKPRPKPGPYRGESNGNGSGA